MRELFHDSIGNSGRARRRARVLVWRCLGAHGLRRVGQPGSRGTATGAAAPRTPPPQAERRGAASDRQAESDTVAAEDESSSAVVVAATRGGGATTDDGGAAALLLSSSSLLLDPLLVADGHEPPVAEHAHELAAGPHGDLAPAFGRCAVGQHWDRGRAQHRHGCRNEAAARLPLIGRRVRMEALPLLRGFGRTVSTAMASSQRTPGSTHDATHSRHTLSTACACARLPPERGLLQHRRVRLVRAVRVDDRSARHARLAADRLPHPRPRERKHDVYAQEARRVDGCLDRVVEAALLLRRSGAGNPAQVRLQERVPAKTHQRRIILCRKPPAPRPPRCWARTSPSSPCASAAPSAPAAARTPAAASPLP